MNEKSTIDLEQILGSTHPKNFEAYCVSNKESVNGDELAFVEYFKSLFKEKCITQQMVFLKSSVPTYTITAFWQSGRYKGFEWTPLFRRTEK